MKKYKRTFIVVVAFTCATLVFYAINLASKKGQGPLSATMQEIESAIIGDSTQSVNSTDSNQDSLSDYDTVKRVAISVSRNQLKNPQKILMGYSGSTYSSITKATHDMDSKLGVRMDLIQIYKAWGSKQSEQFPTDEVKEIVALGSIPLITWEPWLSDFSAKIPNQASPEMREVNPLKAIYNGVYDDYIKQWALDAKRINAPIYLRFAHEMNDPYRYPWGPHNNDPGDFNKAWIHVHQIFKELKVQNILWVWSIHSAYAGYQEYYPGDAYVDIVATGILNFGSSVYWSKWWSFNELFAPHYNELSSFGKPIIIVEFGSLKVGGNREKWYAQALNSIPQTYKNVKGVVFFNFPADKTLTDKSVSWILDPDKKETKAIQRILKNWKDSNFLYP
jgi:beta-mannanase